MRNRLVLAIVGVTAAAVVLFAFPLGLVLKRTFRDDELIKLQRDAVAATRSIDTTGQPGDSIELPDSSDQLAVYGPGGRLLAGSGPKSPPQQVRLAMDEARLATDSSGGNFTVAVPLLENERVSGALFAVRDDSGVDRREQNAGLALAGLALFIVALSVGAAVLTARRLARPLERLAEAAGNVDQRALIEGMPPAGIEELDAIAASLSQSARRLEETLARERSFSADASHQMRTPLAALRLELESIELEGRPPEQIGAAIEQVDRLSKTIDTLLSVVRDTPRQDHRADLVAVADRVERAWNAKLAPAGRPLRVSSDELGVLVDADPAVVEQILNVLVENADRHGAGTVSIRIRKIGDWGAVDVVDEGEGFVEGLADVFDRRRFRDGGHGIGLPLARSLAEAEGGSLRIAEAGPGPVLTLLLRR